MQDRRTSSIREWMASSPSGPCEAMVKHFEEFAKSWKLLTYTEGTTEEVFTLFSQCLEIDAKAGAVDMNVTGVVKPEHFEGFPNKPPCNWWPREVHGSFIQVQDGCGYHLLGKIGDDRFMILVHSGAVADEIARRRFGTGAVEAVGMQIMTAAYRWETAHAEAQAAVSCSSDQFREVSRRTGTVKEEMEKLVERLLGEARNKKILDDVLLLLQKKGARAALYIVDHYL